MPLTLCKYSSNLYNTTLSNPSPVYERTGRTENLRFPRNIPLDFKFVTSDFTTPLKKVSNNLGFSCEVQQTCSIVFYNLTISLLKIQSSSTHWYYKLEISDYRQILFLYFLEFCRLLFTCLTATWETNPNIWPGWRHILNMWYVRASARLVPTPY